MCKMLGEMTNSLISRFYDGKRRPKAEAARESHRDGGITSWNNFEFLHFALCAISLDFGLVLIEIPDGE